MQVALIVIDMLHEFVYGRLRSPSAQDIVPGIRRLIDEARKHGVPVIHVIDHHLPHDHEFRIWGPHALAGSPEAQIIDDLKPRNGDIVLYKRSYSGFRDTGLDILLRDLGVDTVVLTGIHTHVCVLHTASDAFYYGYKIFVVKDAVAAFSKKDHDYALDYMKSIYGAEIISLDKALELIRRKE